MAAPTSVRFPTDLDEEVDRFLEETEYYASRNEFIKEAVRTHLQRLNNDAGIFALRIEKMLERTEGMSANELDRKEINSALDDLAEGIDAESLNASIEKAESDVDEAVFGSEERRENTR